MAGPSDLPDPSTHAYRRDLADVALAGRVIASHYAKPLACRIVEATNLRAKPSEDSEAIVHLAAGASFELLDDSSGWSWGYAGPQRRVGYVRSETVTA